MTELPDHVGTRLRLAREAAGKSLADIAAQTKVPARLLALIEQGQIESLPSGPYATGFARSFARAVGLNEQDVAADIRIMQQQQNPGIASTFDHYEPADATRVPPRAFAWAAGLIFVLLLGGYLVFRTLSAEPDASPAPAPAAPSAAARPATTGATASAAIAPDAAVVLSARDAVWFGLNSADGRLAFERTLNAGESYVLTAEQRQWTLRTGRPQALRIAIGGRELPQLGPDDVLVKNVALDAASLARRFTPASAGPADTGGQPGAAATPSTTGT